MQVVPLSSAYMPTLFEFWYDLEVLRAQLFRLADPSYDREGWYKLQEARLAQATTLGMMCVDEEILGAIAVTLSAPLAHVQLFVVDLHTPERRAVGTVLWNALRDTLLTRSVTHLQADARHNLPIEEAFWRAQKATRTDIYWEVNL